MTEISTDTEVATYTISALDGEPYSRPGTPNPAYPAEGQWVKLADHRRAIASHQSALAQSAAENREIAMQGLAAEGQAQEAYEKLTAARAEIERLTDMRVGIYFGLIAGMVIGGWLGFGLELLGLASFSAGMLAYAIFRFARNALEGE